MNVYIDLPNLRSYAKQCGNPNFRTCTEMLRRNFDLHFTFKKECVESEKKQSKAFIMTLMKMLTANRGNSASFQWDTTFPDRPLSEDLYDSLSNEQLMSVYLLDDTNISTMVSHGCLLFAAVGDEMKALSSLLIEGQMIPTKKYALRELKNWDIVTVNASPCTDIIIVDPYIFAQSDMLYEYNSYSLIENLASLNCGHPLNIVIFTFNNHKDGNTRINVPFVTIRRQLKERLMDKTGTEHNITFVTLPDKKEHDRYIITNYKMFESGNSFTYFNDKWKNISTGRWFNVSTHGDKDNRKQSLYTISDLQVIVDEASKGLNSITGDKKSNFLKF